jgi:hypothetical protein
MVEVIHLDSCVLRALLDPAEDRMRKSDATHLVNLEFPGFRHIGH